MNIAEQLQADINFNEVISILSRELITNDRVLISSYLAKNNVERLVKEGFEVNSDGQWREGGVYVSFKKKNQWR